MLCIYFELDRISERTFSVIFLTVNNRSPALSVSPVAITHVHRYKQEASNKKIDLNHWEIITRT